MKSYVLFRSGGIIWKFVDEQNGCGVLFSIQCTEVRVVILVDVYIVRMVYAMLLFYKNNLITSLFRRDNGITARAVLQKKTKLLDKQTVLATYNTRCGRYFGRAFGSNDVSILEVRAS